MGICEWKCIYVFDREFAGKMKIKSMRSVLK